MTGWLPRVVWNVDPVIGEIGGDPIRYYTLCVFLTTVVGYALLAWQVSRGGGVREEAGEFVSYGLLGLLVGARAGHVFLYDFEKFLAEPTWALKIWKGGLSSHGAAVGLALGMYWFTRRRALPFLEGCDRLVPAIPVGAFLFRLGNLMNSEIVGKPTDGTWGFQFPRFDHGLDAPLRHPSQLYEMALALLVLGVVLAADRRLGHEARPRGALTGILLLTLFSGRFFVEFLKQPEGGQILGVFNRAQQLSLPLVILGAWILHDSLKKRLPAGWSVAAPG